MISQVIVVPDKFSFFKTDRMLCNQDISEDIIKLQAAILNPVTYLLVLVVGTGRQGVTVSFVKHGIVFSDTA